MKDLERVDILAEIRAQREAQIAALLRLAAVFILGMAAGALALMMVTS
jgi:hypothetical protein